MSKYKNRSKKQFPTIDREENQPTTNNIQPRDIEVKPSRKGATDITPLKSSTSKYVSIHCSPEDKERLKEMAVMNETTMVHLMEIGVQYMATQEQLELEDKVSKLQQSPTIRIHPEDKKTLKKLAYKYKTTNLNMIANIADYLEERYK
ncbi:hypothetical protein [Marinococcus halophilus]|uniref:hypothetical protein n=1 Tax=Marinococcus halophilus TaxID=1371 RepID=UPI0009A5EDC3|nr:hypothetical protein [Marinococcus halophilus]